MQLTIWAEEFNIFCGSSMPMGYRRDEGGVWKKNFFISDRLGSLRCTLSDTGAVLAANDFLPFGKEILANSARLAYIGKERDKESSLADHGVRKYDAETGRFTSCDALWGKYISLTPYQYSANNPISFVDFDGKYFKVTLGDPKVVMNNIEQTIEYLFANGADEQALILLEMKHDPENVYYVDCHSTCSNRFTNKIEWNPSQSMEYNSNPNEIDVSYPGRFQTPALIFLHEALHAKIDKELKNKMKEARSDEEAGQIRKEFYDKMPFGLEAYIIDICNEASKKCGEVVRKTHFVNEVKWHPVNSVTALCPE